MARWTTEQDERLLALWGEDRTILDIAVILEVPRDAAAGRLRRLREAGAEMPRRRRPKEADPEQAAKPKRAKRVKPVKPVATPEPVEPEPVAEVAQAPEPVAKAPEPVPAAPKPLKPPRRYLPPPERSQFLRVMNSLRGDQCRWMEGSSRGEDFAVCSNRAKAGTSWCPEHLSRAYTRRPAS